MRLPLPCPDNQGTRVYEGLFCLNSAETTFNVQKNQTREQLLLSSKQPCGKIVKNCAMLARIPQEQQFLKHANTAF
jgi:hypothetical protein